MKNDKVFVQRIGLIGITNLLLSLSGIILLPILTKNVTVEEYGIWAQVIATIGMLSAILTLGLQTSMVRFIPSLKTKENLQDFFYSSFTLIIFTSGLVSVLIYILSGDISAILFGNNIFVVKILSFIVLIETMLYFLLTYFRAVQKIKQHSVLLFLKAFLRIVLISIFVLSGIGIFGAMVGLILSSLVVFLIAIYCAIKNVGFKHPKYYNMKEYVYVGLPTIPAYLSSWIVNSSDLYVIGIILGPASVGYYSPGYALGSIMSMFLSPLTFMLPMVLSKYYDENNLTEVRKFLAYSLKYYVAISIPSVFGISILSKPILYIVSTPEIASKGYVITPFVALGTLFLGFFTIFQMIILLEKKTKIVGIIWILAAVVNLVLNVMIIPFLGIMGAAITTLISFILVSISMAFYSSKILKFDINGKFILKCLLASGFISIILIELNPMDLMDIFIAIGICAIIYFITLLSLKGFEQSEYEFLKQLVKS